MATLYTHAFVGLGLGRAYADRRMPALFWVLVSLLPIVPDLDAFSDAAYGAMLGHRGFTHSLCFALGMAVVAASLTFRYFRVNLWVLCGLFFVIAASHGILDAFTNGGQGIPFLWPFTIRRYGPWGPIQVADIAFAIPNPWTSRSIRTELLWVWLPTVVLVGLVTLCRRFRRSARTFEPAHHSE